MLPEVPPTYLKPRQPRPPAGAPAAKPGSTTAKSAEAVSAPATSSSVSKPLARFRETAMRLLPARLQPSKATAPTPQLNTYATLKQGDRSLIIAINDGGNIGWSRLGRGGFSEQVMVAM